MKPHERTGVGKGTTDREAAAAAIGEALERYCAGQPDHRRVRRFAWKQRSGDAITPPECVLYSERQYARPGFPYRRKLLIKCEKFTMETIELGRQRVTEKANAARSVVHTIVAGKGKYQFGEKKKVSQPFKKGDTFLIPAKIGEYDIASSGTTEIVVSYVE